MLGSKQLLHKRPSNQLILNQNRGLKNWYNKIKNLGASEILDIAVIGDSIMYESFKKVIMGE